MNLAISILEIALIIVLPMIIFLNRTRSKASTKIYILLLLYLVWYLTYSPFHELCHYLTAKALGLEVLEFHFLPEFWKGDFSGGFVRTAYENSFQEFIVVLSPYARDIVLVAVGYVLVRIKILKRILSVSLVLLFLVLSPFYDLLDNYFAYLRGNLNDFWAMGHFLQNKLLVHLIGVTFLFLAFLSCLAGLKYAFKQATKDSTVRRRLDGQA